METSVNNKCKAFTSLEQSRKLAEILPLESADMYYTPPLIKGHTDYIPHLKRKLPIDWVIEQKTTCWSLAALLDVLSYPSLHKLYIGWRCDTYNEEGEVQQIGEDADNPIDACYEMILNLNEQKLL